MSTRLVPLALFFLLCATTATPAAAVETPLGDPPTLALEEEEPEAEAAAEESEEECEELEEGFEECEEVESEPERAGRFPPEKCLLRSARAHAALDGRGEKLKLTIGYTAYEPVGVKIEIGMGAKRIASVQRHLGRSGVLRIVKGLGKVDAPKRIVVRLEIPATPRYCSKYQVQKVKVR
jgi:hypothetical protein